MPSYSKLNVLLALKQSALGTKQSALTSANFMAVGSNFSIDPRYNVQPLDVINGTLGQAKSVRGDVPVDISVELPCYPTGSTTESIFENFLKCSGMSQTVSTNLRTYAITSAPNAAALLAWEDMTLWEYTGDLASDDGLLTKVHSAMFDWKMAGELGKPLMFTATGKGVLDGAPAAASYVTGTLTPQTTAIIALIKASTMTIPGLTGMKIIKFDVTPGNSLVLIKDPSQDYGYLRCDIGGRDPVFNATIYQENLNPNNPYTIIDTPTLGDFQFTFGVAGSRITVKSSTGATQITDIKKGNDEGLNTFDISGKFIGDSLSVIVNDA